MKDYNVTLTMQIQADDEDEAIDKMLDIVAGIFANPASGNVAIDSYGRQQIMGQVFNDIMMALQNMGCQIKDN